MASNGTGEQQQEAAAAPASNADGSSSTPTYPALGDVRCYWAIMDASMNFRFLDPVLESHLREQAPLMLGKNLVDFIHPEEKEAARADFAKFRTSTTIFGSVTRCRYARPVHCRRILGAANPETDGEQSGKYLDESWLACRVTASVVADNTVLTFFHGLQDVNPVADNDINSPNAWSNRCGPLVSSPSSEYLIGPTVEQLSAAFQACQDTSPDAEAKVARGDAPGVPSYVFQILESGNTNVLFTWPPTKPTGKGLDAALYGSADQDAEQQRYAPESYAGLALSVVQKPRANVIAETNCTKRFQSTHPIIKDEQLYSLESVVITYQALTFVCFQTGGILLNSSSVSMAPNMSASLKRGNEDGAAMDADEAIKRLRQVDQSGMMSSYGPGQGGEGYQQWQQSPYPSWQGQGMTDGSLQSPPTYQGGAYPSVYSNMFQPGSSTGPGGEGGNNFPAMPPAAAGGAEAAGANGLADLASASSYYSDYNPNGQYPGMGEGSSAGYAGGPDRNSVPGAPVLHRVRKNDRNRICTSCGTTNSPEWRKGPSGIKTLCNACGLRYARAQARKAKKAQKEAAAAQAAAAAAGGPAVGGNNTPVTYAQGPPQPQPQQQRQNGADSSYISVDYSQQQQQGSLPPLPAPGAGGDGSNGAGDGSAQAATAQQHPGSTAPNYGGYGAFHGFGPYGDWSPAPTASADASFAQQQQQPPQQPSQGQGQGQPEGQQAQQPAGQ